MLKLAILFFVLALLAAIFGFGELAGAFAVIAQVLFFIFLTLFVLAIIAAVAVGRKLKSKWSGHQSAE